MPSSVYYSAPGLKARRSALGLTKEQFAAMVGVSTPTIRNLERGGTVYPSTIRRIAKALRISVAELTRQEDDE